MAGLDCISLALLPGLSWAQAGRLLDLAVTVLLLSVLRHGIGAQRLLAWRQQR